MAEVELRLFSGPNCGLCDDAVDLVSPFVGDGYRLQIVDVTSSLELKKRYGLKIPVLCRDDTGEELNWPFDQARVQAFLS